MNRLDSMGKALVALEKSIRTYQRACMLAKVPAGSEVLFETREDMVRSTRDSMIQCFEFCVDTLGKCMRDFLRAKRMRLPNQFYQTILRTLCEAGVLDEAAAHAALIMIDHRNITSHLYKEEIAERVAVHIPEHYKLMREIICKISQES